MPSCLRALLRGVLGALGGFKGISGGLRGLQGMPCRNEFQYAS